MSKDRETAGEEREAEKRLKREERARRIEKRFPFINIAAALKLCCVGFAGGVVLRVIQMLYFFDYDTGFYTDNGLMARCSLLVALVPGALAAGMCLAVRGRFSAYRPVKGIFPGVVCALSGAALIAAAFMQWQSYGSAQQSGSSLSLENAENNVICLVLIVATALFGIVQLFLSISFFSGKNLLSRVPLIYLIPVLWGVTTLILVYVFYARSSSFVENFFTVAGTASTLLSLFYMCELFAGADEVSASLRVHIFGIFSSVLNISYSLANMALRLLGRSYTGEMPMPLQLSSLAVSAFILVFLICFRIKKYGRRYSSGEIYPGEEGERPRGASSRGKRFRPD